MKNIKTYKIYNESLKDKLKGKSSEEIELARTNFINKIVNNINKFVEKGSQKLEDVTPDYVSKVAFLMSNASLELTKEDEIKISNIIKNENN